MEKHSRREDWIAILTGTFLVAQGVFFLQSANLLTGGTTGLALLVTQFTPFTFGMLYFLANCPFYLLAWKRYGRRFAFNSAISGGLVSIFADNLYLVISVEHINEVYCAIAGGLLMGLGMLILFRHRSSLGALTCFASTSKINLVFQWANRRWQLMQPSYLLPFSLSARPRSHCRFSALLH